MTASAAASATDEPRPLGRAIAWLAVLGVIFFGTYGFANWLASTRPGVPVFVFEWERHIPFLAWTIIPYWSIDLLYGVSVLICRTRRELATQVKRLLTAQVISIACFIAFPLRFSFDRPAAGGVFGWLFDALVSFDKPFNQAPSLHIALLVIIWVRLLAHVRAPALRWITHAWMLLIGASVLTTYQHHFIDLPTGALAGFVCLWLWPENGPSPLALWRRSGDPQRRRLAMRYLAGAAACAAAAVGVGGWALWLWWPAAALLLVALNYAGFGETGFQKSGEGKLSPGARWLLAPYLAGAWINSRAWTRGEPPAHAVADDVWLGRLPTGSELAASPFRALVDLTAEMSADAGTRSYSAHPVLDLTVAPPATLAAAARAIERHRAAGPVLVCCALGYSRSASAVAAWLLATGRARDVAEAVDAIGRARPRVVLSGEHRRVLAAVIG
ncbi:MAG TPA: phosphatase PAP2/dual specificity phosphatase family protein [Burkholderiales bacterium]|nr:phosphatase PAP2/dual specificity phosphatase family protein [Burkholderiales bacterium]